MSNTSESKDLMSPLFEYCETKLQEFEDLTDEVKLEATARVRTLLCTKVSEESTDNSPGPPSSSEDSSPSTGTCNTADLETDDEVHFNWTCNAVLEIMRSPEAPPEHPRLLSDCIENFVQEQDKSVPLRKQEKRRRLFVMLTSAKEFLTEKMRKIFNIEAPAIEPAPEPAPPVVDVGSSEPAPLGDIGSSVTAASLKEAETVSKSTSGSDGFEADDERMESSNTPPR